jgi:hypothetical protein
MRWAGHVASTGVKGNAHRIFVGRPQGKGPLGRPRWEDNNKVDLKVIGWGGMDWTDLARGPVEGSYGRGKCLHSVKCWEIVEYFHNWQLLKKGSGPCS